MRKRTIRQYAGMILGRILWQFIFWTGLYLAVVAAVTGLINLFSAFPDITKGEAVLLLGYGVYALSEYASCVFGGKTLFMSTLDMLIDHISRTSD